MTKLEKQIVEEEVLKLDLKIKRLGIKALKELLGSLGGLKAILIPSRSRIENAFKLWSLGMILAVLIIIVVIMKS